MNISTLFFDWEKDVHIIMLWFSFILGLNFIFHCFKLIMTHNHTQEQWEDKISTKDKFKPQHV